MNNKLFAGVLLGAVGVVGVGMNEILAPDTGCTSLSDYGVEPTDAVEHTIAVEIGGNTEEWQREVRKFARDELERSADVSPTKPLVVRFVFTKDGAVHTPDDPCLRQPLVFAPGAQDLRTYEDGSPKTREAQLELMRETRMTRIGTVLDEVEREIAATSFAGIDDVRMTVLPLWSAASQPYSDDAYVRFVSILSPLHSNADDCLDADGIAADQLVRDCVDFDQLEVIDDATVKVGYVGAVVVTHQQRNWATAIRDALCDHATLDGCVGADDESDSPSNQ